MKSPASKIVDRALETLIDSLEEEQELAALEKFPYEADPAVSWEVDSTAELPYQGQVPEEMIRLAAERRRAKTR